jgi:hypothetical protein
VSVLQKSSITVVVTPFGNLPIASFDGVKGCLWTPVFKPFLNTNCFPKKSQTLFSFPQKTPTLLGTTLVAGLNLECNLEEEEEEEEEVLFTKVCSFAAAAALDPSQLTRGPDPITIIMVSILQNQQTSASTSQSTDPPTSFFFFPRQNPNPSMELQAAKTQLLLQKQTKPNSNSVGKNTKSPSKMA